MDLLVSTTFGLEAIVKREISRLGYHSQGDKPGWVRLQGDWSTVAQLNLWLRTADRVYIQLLQFPAADFDALYDTLSDTDFSDIIPADANFPITARSRRSDLASIPAIQRTVKKAMVNSLQKFHRVHSLAETGAVYPLELILVDNQATLLLNTSGTALHQRGYRSRGNPYLLKETIAAAMVMLSVWPHQFFSQGIPDPAGEGQTLTIPPRMLADPFCSDGAIPIEGAMIAADQPPGLFRSFAFQHWPYLAETQWQEIKQAAIEQSAQAVRQREIQILGSDRNPKKLEIARLQAQKGGVEKWIRWETKMFENLDCPQEYGCLVSYPPFSDHEEDRYAQKRLYQTIPGVMQRLPTWSLFLLTPFPQFEELVQRTADRRRKMHNHLRECVYYQYLGPRPTPTVRSTTVAAIPMGDTGQVGQVEQKPGVAEEISSSSNPRNTGGPDNSRGTPLFGALTEKDHQQSVLFRNRLVKQARHLRRWPKRGISCYRLYERDIPEIPLVIDRYENYLHITEYERPHDRDLARHSAWLELMRKTAAESLEVPLANVFLKSRVMEEAQRQYQKIDRLGDLIVVSEGGLKFYVNLTDYVDTGLFLDHRITRSRVAQEGVGQDVLNLFAYTGSFSVYAAAAGAKSTTTVDLSKTYLDWAVKNFQLNQLSLDRHAFIQSDALGFLKQLAAARETPFDLAIVDPPTYSNSKRTDQDWDVQRNHSELLQTLASVLRPGGVVYFSTNFRRFKLAEDALRMFQIQEISHKTVPDDFRNRRIHRCWRLAKQTTDPLPLQN